MLPLFVFKEENSILVATMVIYKYNFESENSIVSMESSIEPVHAFHKVLPEQWHRLSMPVGVDSELHTVKRSRRYYGKYRQVAASTCTVTFTAPVNYLQ